MASLGLNDPQNRYTMLVKEAMKARRSFENVYIIFCHKTFKSTTVVAWIQLFIQCSIWNHDINRADTGCVKLNWVVVQIVIWLLVIYTNVMPPYRDVNPYDRQYLSSGKTTGASVIWWDVCCDVIAANHLQTVTKWPPFSRRRFKCDFLYYLMHLLLNSVEVCSWWRHQQ